MWFYKTVWSDKLIQLFTEKIIQLLLNLLLQVDFSFLGAVFTRLFMKHLMQGRAGHLKGAAAVKQSSPALLGPFLKSQQKKNKI